MQSWLLDEGARDQFAVRYGDETEIWWNDPTKPNHEPEYSRRNWSENYVSWSPQGTYLATFHRLCIQLWGGPSWKKLLKFNHGGVKLLDFSPGEKFLVTWSPETDQVRPPARPPARAAPRRAARVRARSRGPTRALSPQNEALVVWDTSTGEKLRAFPGAKDDAQMDWPAFQW